MPPPVPDKIPCESEQQLKQELAACQEVLAIPETEDSWEKISRAIARLSALVKGGAYKHPHVLVAGVRSCSRPLLGAMNSERTRLSATSLDLLTCLAPRLDHHFESLMPVFVPSILKLCARTNKLYIARARAFLEAITSLASLTSLIPYLQACWDDKSTTLRAAAIDTMLVALKKFNPPDLHKYISHIEMAIKCTGRDKDPAVRTTSRKVFDCYRVLWPDRVDMFTAPMSPVLRKYLDIQARSRAVSVLVDTRDPLSVSVPNSHASLRPRLRRSLSVDALNEPRAPKVDRRLQQVPPEVTKVVPVRRARAQKLAQEAQPSVPSNPQEVNFKPALAQAPKLSRAISMANLRSRGNQEEPLAGSSPAQQESKGPRRVVQPVAPPLPPTLTRSGPSRPNFVSQPSDNHRVPTPPLSVNSVPESDGRVTSPDPIAASNSTGERRGQGAQRVLIPQKLQPEPARTGVPTGPTRPAKASEKMKSFRPGSRNANAPAKSTVQPSAAPEPSSKANPSKTEPPTKDSRPASRADSTRSNSRLAMAKPVKSAVPKPTSSKTLGATAQSAKEDKAAMPPPAVPRRGLTAPTKAQLSRAKALENERANVKQSVPVNHSTNPARRGFIPTRGGRGRLPVASGQANMQRRVKESPIPEAEVPLPSSPKVEPIGQADVESNDLLVRPLLSPSPEEVPMLDNEAKEDKQASPPHEVITEIEVVEEGSAHEREPLHVSPPPMLVSQVVDVEGDSSAKPESAPIMSEVDRLLFSSPMKPINFEPVMSSSPSELVKEQQKASLNATPVAGTEGLQFQTSASSEIAKDPYASLPFFLREALAAPIPPTPNSRPSPFIRYETDIDTTVSYSPAHHDESDDENTMDKLEFAVNGVDPFGRIIKSPSKRTAVAQRDALINLSLNQ